MRVKIFVDFWNFQIEWNNYHRNMNNNNVIKIPWDSTFPEVLTDLLGKEAVYAGTHVYASIDPRKTADRKLSNFLHHMNGFKGFNVTIKERKPASPIRCPDKDCHQQIDTCPHCSKTIIRSVEKGVDAALIVDMIQLAIDDRYDRGILVSGDRDFIGAVDFIQGRMKRISHVWFRNRANELQNVCWDHFFFENIMGQLLPNTD